MKITPASVTVPTYSISDFSNAANIGIIKKFHVSKLDGYVANESMLNTPIRLDHFSIGLFIEGGGNILLNMNSYQLTKNSFYPHAK